VLAVSLHVSILASAKNQGLTQLTTYLDSPYFKQNLIATGPPLSEVTATSHSGPASVQSGTASPIGTGTGSDGQKDGLDPTVVVAMVVCGAVIILVVLCMAFYAFIDRPSKTGVWAHMQDSASTEIPMESFHSVGRGVDAGVVVQGTAVGPDDQSSFDYMTQYEAQFRIHDAPGVPPTFMPMQAPPEYATYSEVAPAHAVVNMDDVTKRQPMDDGARMDDEQSSVPTSPPRKE